MLQDQDTKKQNIMLSKYSVGKQPNDYHHGNNGVVKEISKPIDLHKHGSYNRLVSVHLNFIVVR